MSAASYIRRETAIAIAINSAFSAAFTYLIFSARNPIELWGAKGLALDFVPQTFIITLLTVTIPTLLTRKRVRTGEVIGTAGPTTRWPRNVLLRAVLWAIVATVVLGGAATLLLALIWRPAPSFATVLAGKILYGAIVAGLVAPRALRAALLDK